MPRIVKIEGFTQTARLVLKAAEEEAKLLQHKFISPHHVLLGFMSEDNVAGSILIEMGLEQNRVRELVKQLTTSSVHDGPVQLDVSRGTKKVLELAVTEAQKMGHSYIGSEHLLLGVVWQGKSVAIDVLKQLGVTPKEIRLQVYQVLGERPVQSQNNMGLGNFVRAIITRLAKMNPFTRLSHTDDTEA